MSRHLEEDAMKGRVLLGLVLTVVIVLSMVEVIGTVTVAPVDSTAVSAGNPCVTDADCTGNRICCPISQTCTTPRGCRKDPLQGGCTSDSSNAY
jgi:hypothetical protein